MKQETIFDKEDGEWKYSAKVVYKIIGSDIEEITTGLFGTKEVSFTENYNLDYLWTTKLAPRDILSSDEAGKVLFDKKIMEKYKNEMLKITNGKIYNSENLKILINTEGDTIRIEKIIQQEDKSIKNLASNFLQREFEKETTYSEHGDTKFVNNRNYEYKYDNNAVWKFVSRGGYLIRREIF